MSDAKLLRTFVAELAAAGVRDAVVCPGSRSTPLALALRESTDIRVRVLLDERAAGFFALGMARTDRRPVAVLVTSGTAAMELGPAVVEAAYARVPLVVLTADRPPEMRDRGAAQTIDQDHLFGRSAKWFSELPLFDADPVTEMHVRSVAGRAVATATSGPAGPVHLNAPFREPLLPDGTLSATGDPRTTHARPTLTALRGRLGLDGAALDELARRVGRVGRGLIVAGPDYDPRLPPALAALARATGFPILADPLSGLRTGSHDRSLVVARGDQLVRPGPWIDAHRPDLVIRTGGMPTSKPVAELLATVRPELIVVDGDAGWRESALVPATFVHADPAAAAEALAGRQVARRVDPAWSADWLQADAKATRAMAAWLAGLDEPFEGAPFEVLGRALPDGATLWAGNSMPVRDMEGWLPSTDRAITVLANRGANGIDGVVSTALGSAAVARGPVALVVGDVSFLHDLNALVAAKLHGLAATIVLVNNDGGGIFSFLPQASAAIPGAGLPQRYEELFGTPHGIDVAPIVTALGGEHVAIEPGDLGAQVERSIGCPGVRVLELRTDRARNVALHREVSEIVAEAIAP